jgi:hypothetical protein
VSESTGLQQDVHNRLPGLTSALQWRQEGLGSSGRFRPDFLSLCAPKVTQSPKAIYITSLRTKNSTACSATPTFRIRIACF